MKAKCYITFEPEWYNYSGSYRALRAVKVVSVTDERPTDLITPSSRVFEFEFDLDPDLFDFRKVSVDIADTQVTAQIAADLKEWSNGS